MNRQPVTSMVDASARIGGAPPAAWATNGTDAGKLRMGLVTR
ncbi:hypothetical protein [Streptomyces sp. BH105]